MPVRQPFTALCQATARLSIPGIRTATGRADLHLHTTFSDGEYTPAQVVEIARLSGLKAIAITDHDTLDGIAPAWAASVGTEVEIIPAVEVSAEFAEREVHILGYFVRPDDGSLRQALERLGRHREQRFWDMVERLRSCGVTVDETELRQMEVGGVLGRRNLAELLVRGGQVGTIRDAFRRYLADGGRIALPKVLLPAAEAVALIRGAGGVASWAHPPFDRAREGLLGLKPLGLGAVEVEFPGVKSSRGRHLRMWAAELGLAVTGGSDCHGPGDWKRAIGSRSVTAAELQSLRSWSL